jgi:hypothetical protein
MKVIGVDPDTKATGIVYWNGEARETKYYVARAKGRFVRDRAAEMARNICLATEEFGCVDLVVIEWMKYRPRKERNPQNIIDLQAVTGMVTAAFADLTIDMMFPYPDEWKGEQDKKNHHPLILRKAGIDDFARSVSKADRSHVIDALGLAMWGRDLAMRRQRVNSYRGGK